MTPTTHQYKKFSDFRRDTISYSVDGRTTTMPNMSEKALAYCYENIKPENGFYLEDADTGLLYTIPKIISGKIFFNTLPRSEKNNRYTLLSDLQAYIVANIVRKENPTAKLNLVKAN